MIRNCKICGKEFEPIAPNNQYCSYLCKDIGHKRAIRSWNDKNKGYITIYMREYRKNHLTTR